MSLDLPGFTDPVGDSQSCFRAVLGALSRPGTRHRAGAALSPPAPLGHAAAAVLLTLADADTPLWLEGAPEAAWEWLAFHCGASRAGGPGAAIFAWARSLPDLGTLAQGSDEAPESSATLILQVAAIGAGRTLRLAGPGIATSTVLAVDGLPADFPARWAANHALFPRGVDLILCAGTDLAALPRSVSVEAG